MGPYDSRCSTLDPGLTVLALRGLQNRDRHYPFLERHTRWAKSRGPSPALRGLLASWFPTVRGLLGARLSAG
ncbi:MAG TPA: hypothetical protein VGW35_20810 [Methylomirabilota bacterium]|jgi:hypothetical protein|nr:hypothetical protein [Methylomirabilota bacterium]